MIRYVSPRDLPLVFQDEPGDRPILTVENYVKWYTLYVVHPDGRVREADMTEEDGFRSAWRDHVPHPAACHAYARLKGWEWDENSLDMVYGRYAREVTEVGWGREEF